MELSSEEIKRYNRQIILPDFGEEAQTKLKNSKVLVVGIGGLGSVASLYLTAAGFGTVGLMDDDTVAIHNLQRQILYREDEVGQSKAQRAEETLHRLNSNVNLITYNHRLTPENAAEIISGYNLVLDCTDNYAARYLINETCVKLGKPFI
ncbi:MAG: HesA/MoeB/ThiF family protein [Bacteroidales bacterium]|nr:HesA/MoeB/ThiF family protein [Bacteroidales bacterium]